jgi:murein DD-endopeptidase MepM/ murein hydrolase activator NlpD
MLERLPRAVFKENLEILLIPESGAEIASFKLPRGLFRSLACGALVVLLFVVVSLRVFVVAHDRAERLSVVTAENVDLHQALDGIGEELGVLRASMEQLAEYELRARALAGLGDPEFEEPVLGLGGGDLDHDLGVRPALMQILLETEVSVDSLLLHAETRRRNYELIVSTLRAREEELEAIPSIHPLGASSGWYSSGFGHRKDPFTGRRAFHAGLDISCPQGTPIYATAAGTVVRSGRDGHYGHAVRIDHGNGIVTLYAHNEENVVAKDERVERGQQIAKVGSTGRSTGPHLHYAVLVDGKPVNPFGYILPDDIVVD